MAEYIDIDAQVVVTDTRGRELETTVRHILNMNKGVYTTADVRPVVRGQWEVDGHHIRCPICGEYMCIKDQEGAEIPREYCPNCGARMDGDDDV